MYNYKLLIEYKGTNYFGWQKQKNTDKTIQNIIESSIIKITGKKIKLTGAGRTDSGVHALNQVANFKSENRLEKKKFLYSLNSILPEDISIKNLMIAGTDFHSRYSAVRREYIYKISADKKAVENQFYYKLNYDLDFEKIDEFIKIITGYKSFRSLCKNKTDKHNFMCYLYFITYTFRNRKRDMIFKISASRFLHSMVRGIIGCLVDIGRNKLDLKDTTDKFLKGEKIRTTYLPSKALFLNKIYYK